MLRVDDSGTKNMGFHDDHGGGLSWSCYDIVPEITAPWSTNMTHVSRFGRQLNELLMQSVATYYPPSLISHEPNPTPIEYASLTERSTW